MTRVALRGADLGEDIGAHVAAAVPYLIAGASMVGEEKLGQRVAIRPPSTARTSPVM